MDTDDSIERAEFMMRVARARAKDRTTLTPKRTHVVGFIDRYVDAALPEIDKMLGIHSDTVPVDCDCTHDGCDHRISPDTVAQAEAETARVEHETLDRVDYEHYRHDIEAQEWNDWLDQHCSKCGELLREDGECALCRAESLDEQRNDL